MSSGTIVFVSDAHFGLPRDQYENERRASFLRFLASIEGVQRLVIAGDLFQFWFDLGQTMPKGFLDILSGLRRLSQSGTRVDYLSGNHDYWRSSFFRDELGVVTHDGTLVVEAQGRRVLVVHGDGEGPGEQGYKILKRVVRSPVTIAVARVLHPDLVHSVARRMDRWSHSKTSKRPIRTEPIRAAARVAWDRGFDAYVMGHVHTQMHEVEKNRELIVIGDWLELRSYVKLEGGRFESSRWNG